MYFPRTSKLPVLKTVFLYNLDTIVQDTIQQTTANTIDPQLAIASVCQVRGFTPITIAQLRTPSVAPITSAHIAIAFGSGAIISASLARIVTRAAIENVPRISAGKAMRSWSASDRFTLDCLGSWFTAAPHRGISVLRVKDALAATDRPRCADAKLLIFASGTTGSGGERSDRFRETNHK